MATFKPAANLAADTTYTATISDSVRSSSGDKINLPYSWSFTTSTSTITGTPDASFGSGGMVIINGCEEGNALATDSFGRILVAGSSGSTSDFKYHMTVWRYNSDGTPDGSFGSGGMSKQNGSAAGGRSDAIFHDNVTSIVLTSDNKILVLGLSYDPNEKIIMVVWRLNPDGSLDTSFKSSGIWLNPGPTIAGQACSSVTIDDTGKMLAVGTVTIPATVPSPADLYYMIVSRYNPDGTLDKSFSDGTHEGYSIYPGEGSAVTIDINQKILVIGSVRENAASSSGIRVWWVNSDGKLEQTFDASDNNANGMFKIDSSGAILFGGLIYGSGPAIWKFNPDLNLDTTFGQGGIVHFGGEPNERVGPPVFIALDAAGRILATRTKVILTRIEYSTDHFKYYIESSRLNSNGTTDESFGSNGKIIYPDYSPPEDMGLESMGITTDLYRRILVLGKSIQGSSTPVTIFRYK